MSLQHMERRRAPRPLRMIGRILGVIGLSVLGLVTYFVCDDLFSGYPQFHTLLLSIIAMLALTAYGFIMWMVDERRHRDDDDD